MSNIPNNPVNSAPQKAVAKKPAQDDASLAGVIDTIEAIIIALIVALTFRAFIVEAFVIPTGSMAPTLLGAHFKVICPKCGYEFDRDAPLQYQAGIDSNGRYFINRQPNRHAELGPNRLVPCEFPIMCPNCRYAITDPKDMPQWLENHPNVHDQRDGIDKTIPFVWANNGDRILVLKYLYSVMEPKRWDVIVFKEPSEARDNYIKRLIGLPGETIQIVNGDIFVQPRGSVDPRDRQIARKPEEIQRFLWQLVYDNDHYPTDEGQPRAPLAWFNPWEPDGPATDWKKGTTMAYDGRGPGTLKFHPLPAGAPSDYPPYGLNTLGYNDDLYVDDYTTGSGEFAPRSIVGDLRLEALWTPHSQDARSISLTLGRPNNCFRVEWNAQGLKLSRFNVGLGKFEDVAATTAATGGAALPAPPRAGESCALALNNVDHAIRFYIDGKNVLCFEEPWNAQQAIDDLARFPADWTNARTMDAQVREAANKGRANQMIQIDVGGPCALAHLKLYRDLYYTQVTKAYDDYLKQKYGRSATGTQESPVTLGDGEFFAMGDNSRRSSDGRLWTDVYDPLGDLGLRAGIVPRRYLLGKAFFVYWPAGFRPAAQIPLIRICLWCPTRAICASSGNGPWESDSSVHRRL